MSDAVVEVLRWGFEVVGFNRIHALAMISNERSIRLLERSRFTREGLLSKFPNRTWYTARLLDLQCVAGRVVAAGEERQNNRMSLAGRRRVHGELTSALACRGSCGALETARI